MAVVEKGKRVSPANRRACCVVLFQECVGHLLVQSQIYSSEKATHTASSTRNLANGRTCGAAAASRGQRDKEERTEKRTKREREKGRSENL